MVFPKDGERKLCTPYMDTTGYGNLRFYFVMGRYILNKFRWPRANSRPAPIPEEVKLFVIYNIKWKFRKYEFYCWAKAWGAHTCFRWTLLEPSCKRASFGMPWLGLKTKCHNPFLITSFVVIAEKTMEKNWEQSNSPVQCPSFQKPVLQVSHLFSWGIILLLWEAKKEKGL